MGNKIIDWVLQNPILAICGVMIFDMILVFGIVFLMAG